MHDRRLGHVYLLLKELDRGGSIVIRRSTIKYQEPVTSPEIFARCQPVSAEARQYFLEMLDDKRQAKLDLVVEIAGPTDPLVSVQRLVRRDAERRDA